MSPATSTASAPFAVAAPVGALDWEPIRIVTRGGVDKHDDDSVNLAVGHGRRAAVIYSGPRRNDVQVRRLQASGGWSAPVTIGQGRSPRIVLDRSGNATAVWIKAGFDLMSARQPAGGRWSKPRRISPLTPDPHRSVVVGIFEVDLAANADGDVAAAWNISSMDDDELPFPAQVAHRPAGEGWGPPRTIHPDTDVGRTPRVALRAGGDLVAVYATHDSVMTRDRIVGEGWTPPVQLASDFGLVDVAVGAGSSVAAWTSWVPRSPTLTAARRPAGQPWAKPITFDPPGGTWGDGVRVWVDGTGRATAAWRQNRIAITRSAAPSGNWGPQTTFGKALGAVDLAGNSAGDLLLAWRAKSAGNVRVAYRPAGRRWAPSVALGSGHHPLVGVYPNGETLTVWGRGDGLVSRHGQL